LPSGGAVSSYLPCLVSLSSVLEQGPIPPKYFLSAVACEGILRRAKARGKALPPALHSALLSVVERVAEPQS